MGAVVGHASVPIPSSSGGGPGASAHAKPSPWDPLSLRRRAAQLRASQPGKARVSVRELLELAEQARAAVASGASSTAPPPPPPLTAVVPKVFIPLLPKRGDRLRIFTPQPAQLASLAADAVAGVGGSDAAREESPDAGSAEVSALADSSQATRVWRCYQPLQWLGGDDWQALELPRLGAKRSASDTLCRPRSLCSCSSLSTQQRSCGDGGAAAQV